MSANAQTLGSQQPAATTTSANIGGKRGATVRTADVAAKGGMPWTEAEVGDMTSAMEISDGD